MPGDTQNFVSIDIWTMIFAWCNLVILFFILKKLLFKPIMNVITTRQKEIDDMYTDASTSKSEAESMRADYEVKLTRANEESEQIIRNATRKAQLKEEEILRDAQAQASKTLKRAEEQIEMEKKHAMNEIKDEVSDMAVAIASAVLERDIKPEENSAIIDSFIENLGDDK